MRNWRSLFAAWPDQEEGEQGAGGAGGEDGQGEPASPGDRRERESAEHGAGEAADVDIGELHSVIHHKLIIHRAYLIPIWIIPLTFVDFHICCGKGLFYIFTLTSGLFPINIKFPYFNLILSRRKTLRRYPELLRKSLSPSMSRNVKILKRR